MDGYKVDRTLLSSKDMKAILTGLQKENSYEMLHTSICHEQYGGGKNIL